MQVSVPAPADPALGATIRPACEADLPSLISLCADHAAYEGATYDPTGKAEPLRSLLFGEAATLRGLVAAGISGLLGYATWSPQVSTWDARWYAHMDCLYLRPEARGIGLGWHLVARVVRDAHAAGLVQVQWQTPQGNVRAMRFYDRLGATQRPKARFILDAAAFPAFLP
ncbi:MAG: GNAT family N-acetyltransferase [Bacteroidota bacterium]